MCLESPYCPVQSTSVQCSPVQSGPVRFGSVMCVTGNIVKVSTQQLVTGNCQVASGMWQVATFHCPLTAPIKLSKTKLHYAMQHTHTPTIARLEGVCPATGPCMCVCVCTACLPVSAQPKLFIAQCGPDNLC